MNEGHHTIKRYGTTVSVMLMAAVAVAVSAMFVYVKKQLRQYWEQYR